MTEASPNIRPTERSFYHPILELVEELGFTGYQEIKHELGVLDICFQSGKSSFILEVKIGGKHTTDPIIKGLVQAYRYSLSPSYKTRNIIVISYPATTRGNVFSASELRDRILKTRVDALILTEYWYGYETKNTVEEIFGNLKAKIDRKLSDVMRVEIASSVIQRSVKKLAWLIEKIYKNQDQIDEVTSHLTTNGFYLDFDTSKVTKKIKRNQTIHLLAYILVNQILFYFLYSRKALESKCAKKVSPLEQIKHLDNLEEYFEELRAIDFRPIFDIKVAQRIPFNHDIINEVNALIGSLEPLKISKMTREMYGRLIGKYLPPQTRKILASYYTGTASADLLTNLTINNYFDTVWDFSCGSGTLLISSYNRKMRLFQEEKRIIKEDDEEKLHRQFVEHDITGTDIMAFACHLSGLSLSVKNLSVYTDFLRISQMNALRLDVEQLPFRIEEARGNISKSVEAIHNPQPSLESFIKPKKKHMLQSKTFLLDKVDAVILNPPFTRMKRLPPSIRQHFRNSSVGKICGNRIFLWGYFLALADKVVNGGGKIGAIVPISLLHGKDTMKLRRFFLRNYTIEYIIKSVVGKPFSEGSQFTDIILVARKSVPITSHKTRIICFKEDLSDFSTSAIDSLTRKIRSNYLNEVDNNDEYLAFSVAQSELLNNSEKLMRYFFTNNESLKKSINSILDTLVASGLTTQINIGNIEEGYQLRPAGTTDNVVITRSYPKINDSPRVKNVLLSFGLQTDKKCLEYINKKTHKLQKVEKTQLMKTLRSPIGIDLLDASKITDYIFTDSIPLQKEKAHLFISNRFWLKSNEHSLLAFYVDDLICPLNIFTMYKCTKKEAKILSLYFNSIFYIIQVIMLSKQSTRGFLGLKIHDFCNVLIPNISAITQKNKDILETFFEEYKNQKVLSIPTQLQFPNDFRLNLDLIVAKSLGIKISKATLKDIYKGLWNHINGLP